MHAFRSGFRAFAALLILACSAAAQVPQQLAVQARLTDGGGAPVTVPTSVTFRLFDAVSGGTPDFEETEVVAPTSDGVFAATLGDGAALSGTLFDVPRWLELVVDGEVAGPRLPLRSVAYALRAESAGDLSPEANVSMAGNQLTGLPPPSGPTDAARKGYVDGEVATLDGEITTLQTDLTTAEGDIAALQADLANHQGDASIHFGQGSISILHSQVSDFDSAVSTSTHALRVDNPHAVGKAQVGLGNVEDLKVNLTGQVPPTQDDDVTQGYGIGSTWVDRNSGTAYRMTWEDGGGEAFWKAATHSFFSIRVSPVVTAGGVDPVASGDRLETELARIGDASSARPYRLLLEPGRYQVDAPFQLKPHVRLQGSGMGATRLEPSGSILAAYPSAMRDLSIVVSGATTAAVIVDASSELTLRDVSIEGGYVAGGGVDAIAVDGTLELRDCRVSLQTSGAGEVRALAVQDGRLVARGTDVWVTGAATARGITNAGGTVIFAGGRIVATGDGASAIDCGSGSVELSLRGAEIDVTSSGGEAEGVRSGAAGTSILGCTIDVDGDTETATGVRLEAGAARSVVAENRLHVKGEAGLTGLHAGDVLERLSASGNQIRLEGESVIASTHTGVRFAGTFAAAGNGIHLTRPPTAQGDSVGASLTGTGTLAASSIDLDAGEGGATGVSVFGSSAAVSLSGVAIEIESGSNVNPVYGVRSTIAAGQVLRVDSVSLRARSPSQVRGIDVSGDLLAHALDLRVETTDSSSAIAFRNGGGGGAGDRILISGSRLEAISATGTGYIGDFGDDAPSPDLYIVGSFLVADSLGADVLTTASFGP